MEPAIEQIATYLLYASPYMIPLAALGFFYIVSTMVKPWMMSRRGYIRIYYITPSGKIKRTFGKPELEAVHNIHEPGTGKVLNARGYSMTIAKQKRMFVDNIDYIVQDGHIRATFYDPEWNQMSLSKFTKMANPLAGGIIDSMMTRVWNAARASLGREKRNDLIFFIIIGVAAAAAAGLAYQGYQETLATKELVQQLVSRTVASGG